MRLQKNQQTPAFLTEDIYQSALSVPVKGKKTLLSFMRFAGCPVCNLRVHELLKNADKLKAAGVAVVLVYESPRTTMIEYLKDENFPFSFVSDKENKLYDLYSVEKSFFKAMSGMFRGAISKIIEGKKLYKKDPGADGPISRLGADFLIDENGKIIEAYYGNYLGDHLEISKML